MSDTKEEPWTVLRLLEWTTNFFKSRGSESPRLDAEVLLAHARDCARIELYTAFSEVPSEEQRVAFREMIRRRGEGTPVAQLVGYREFYSLRFRVDENVLIPRPETEHLVIEALDVAKAMNISDRPIRIADVGTGSGAIAITLAKNINNAEITAIDLSEAALKIATWNAEHLKVTDSVRLVHSDLFESVAEPATFDIICSNPPYVSESEYEQLDPTVRDHEPREALVAGIDGMDVIKRLLETAPERLEVGGRLIIEISPMIAELCEELVEGTPTLGDLRFIKDLSGQRRIVSLARV
ncbi:Protein-(glutamine-N5) methyltransferase, release factor-specific [Rhodopirellula maiorica SM1]|uniref:Release factor glutamine methyltransferase n=1 Tax=Rhodopirellula maiorica SM1 TaxID=1265738 RepID=M5RTN4_9BACT|nr:peptide chain release factor N(5)-glutamine methyltransferase [Rhodopirellula maiorica]EMI18747.1 Protein-(glutamine-N5) methyltransferase, release factor-specific [Rhodopirellula maiorica SM1]